MPNFRENIERFKTPSESIQCIPQSMAAECLQHNSLVRKIYHTADIGMVYPSVPH